MYRRAILDTTEEIEYIGIEIAVAVVFFLGHGRTYTIPISQRTRSAVG